MSNSQKNFMSIRSKLLAAVAMLLVASFMVVSSTYAWFTLSTAPEVTGITTQVGANGNLEIALATDITVLPGNLNGATNPSMTEKNITWGNIINLADDYYGLDTISLKPSLLSFSEGKLNLNQPLKTPVYGSDGRVSSIETNGFFGSKNTGGQGFVMQGEDGGYGVRALGTVSSMTEQQLQYTSALTALNAKLNAANGYAYTSVTKAYGTNNQIGGGLVSLILKGALNKTSTFTVDELGCLLAMINELKQAPAALKEAVKNFMVLAIAKKAEAQSDIEFKAIMGVFEDEWDDIYTQLGQSGFDGKITLEGITDGYVELSAELAGKLNTIVTTINKISTDVATAESEYNEAVAKGDGFIEWTDVTAVLTPLMDIDKIKVNGETYQWISDAKNASAKEEKDRTEQEKALASAFGEWALAATRGVEIEMTGISETDGKSSGVYADIASVTKNVDINFTPKVTVSYSGFNLQNVDIPVRMFTNIQNILALNAITMPKPSDRGGDTNAVITDTYAYVLDFVFRTNAKDSYLQLQTNGVDRIYANNTSSPATMGGGSYMSIETSTDFGETSVRSLMDNIRLVFVNTKDGTVLAGGKLNTTAPTSSSTVTAPIELYHVSVEGDEFTWGEKMDADMNTETDAKVNEQNIVALGQNEATYISVFVYLDGTSIENADVPATSELEVKMNLQFASSAELKPMDYSGSFETTNP